MDSNPIPIPPRTTPTTTTTSNNIIVPSSAPVAPTPPDDMAAIRLAATWIVGIIVAVKFLLDAAASVIGFFEKKKGVDKEKMSPLEHRVADLENKAQKFRSVEQLDKDNSALQEDLGHVKNGLQMQINGLADRIRTTESSQHDINLKYERLSGKVDNCLEQNSNLVKAVGRIDDKLDKHFESITELLMVRNRVSG